jgi:hypothetical protein
MTRPRTIVDAFDGPFAAWLGDPAEWSAWRVFLKAMTATPLDATELELLHRCTGRETPPATPSTEVWAVVGRRGRNRGDDRGVSGRLSRLAASAG